MGSTESQTFFITVEGAGAVAQVVECLPGKCEFKPKYHKQTNKTKQNNKQKGEAEEGD
jgi:hypothetical protein